MQLLPKTKKKKFDELERPIVGYIMTLPKKPQHTKNQLNGAYDITEITWKLQIMEKS
jgi:hypothetical protein